MADDTDDLSQYLASWQDARGLRGDNPDPDSPPLDPAAGAPDPSPVDPSQAGPAAPMPGPAGTKGPTGPDPSIALSASGRLGSHGQPFSVGVSHPTRNVFGLSFLIPAGSRGTKGTAGSNGMNGTRGPTGQPGPTGLTGPKASIVATERGNLAFSCLEGARPWLVEVMRIQSSQSVRLREDFLAAIVPGSAFVFSVVPEYRCEHGARIEEGAVIVDTLTAFPIRCTVVVAGIHRHFPDWDLPHKTDAERERSRRFWGQEWRADPNP